MTHKLDFFSYMAQKRVFITKKALGIDSVLTGGKIPHVVLVDPLEVLRKDKVAEVAVQNGVHLLVGRLPPRIRSVPLQNVDVLQERLKTTA